MAERKATNKYYPPEWTPDKGSINTFVGQHPLRERARKLSEGILIIRFEMPFNIWCGTCNEHIAKGRRFNAEKKQNGSYFSTKIWSFKMKCYNCSSYFVIETDPKNADYVVKSGAKKKTEDYDPADSGTIVIQSEEDKEKQFENPFAKLEHLKDDEKLGELEIPELERLYEIRDHKSEFDYLRNRIARKKFREEKKVLQDLDKEAKDRGLGIKLLPSSVKDEIESTVFNHPDNKRVIQTPESKRYYYKIKAKMKDSNVLKQTSKDQRTKRKLLEKTYKHGLDLSLFKKRKNEET